MEEETNAKIGIYPTMFGRMSKTDTWMYGQIIVTKNLKRCEKLSNTVKVLLIIFEHMAYTSKHIS